MATYFAALPTDRKVRVHFHEFFRDLHLGIRRHGNNLAAALDELLGGVDLVCFDEFHVHDPADGKFIARLLPALLDRQIRVILTSNYPPRSLMPNPLFHDDFVPSIELIEQFFTVISVDGPVDYRTVSGHEAGFAADGGSAPARRSKGGTGWDCVRPRPTNAQFSLRPDIPSMSCAQLSHSSGWTTPTCVRTPQPPRSTTSPSRDSSARGSSVQCRTFEPRGREPAQRFANVVDVLYDCDITTVFLAATPLSALTDSGRLPVDIERIRSRLGQLAEPELEAAER